MADAPTPGQSAATKVAETVAGKTTEKFWEIIFPLLADLGIGGAFHYFAQRHLEGKLSEIDKKKVEEAHALNAAGKKEEARQVIQAHIGGFGFNDEYIVWSTSLRVLFAGVLAQEQRVNFCRFLNGMTARENKKFREMFTVETSEDLRDVNLLRFAQLPQGEMQATLNGSGTFRMTTWDHIDASAQALAERLQPHYEAMLGKFMARLSGTYVPPTAPRPTTQTRNRFVRAWDALRGR